MTLRLLHLSDIHFGCENAGAVAAARSYADEAGADAIVVTGDITQFGWRDEFTSASAWLRQLTGPVICTPGNHDTPYLGVLDRMVNPFGRYAAAIGPADEDRILRRGLVILAINTARGAQLRMNWSKGAIRTRDAVKAAQAAAAANGALKVVICHHPLMEVTGGPMTGRVWGGRRASEILVAGKVDLILTGHVHMPFAHALPFGDGRTYAVGASTLSLRERGCPAGFNLIEAEHDRITVSALGWTGSVFEPQRTWGFDRRQA
jgi:3',5'-cyclic AMP phosphodiesterase CpdA